MLTEIFRRETFDDPVETEAFAAHEGESKFHARRAFLFTGAFTYLSYCVLDYIVAGEHGLTFVAIRIALVTPIMLAVSYAFWTGRMKGRESLAFGIFSVPATASIVYMGLVLEGPIAALYPMGMLVLALFMSLLMLPSFRFTAFMVVQVLLGTAILALFPATTAESLYTLHYFLWMSGVVLLAGMFFHENTERRQFKYKRDLEKTVATLRQSESRAMELYHEAKQAERAKDEFLAVVSHELRTPMNAIIGFSEIISTEMMGKVEPAQYRDYAVHINKSGLQLLNIINDILDISRADISKMNFETAPFDMGDALAAAITACSANAEEAGVTVRRAEPALSDVTVQGDEARLMQALTNIVGNAIKFSKEGGSVTVDMAFSPAGELVLSVGDDGIGISPEDIEQIKQPFQQAEGAFTRNNGGLGLGLAITNIVATAHRGELRIESALGEGTTVSIVLPPDCVVSTMERRA